MSKRVLLLLAACSVPPLNVEGKRCQLGEDCGAPFICAVAPGEAAGVCIRPGCAAPSAEVCDGADNDCNGYVDDLPLCLVTLAGSAPPGFADGPASAARFSGPMFLSADGLGRLLVAEAYGHRVRRLAGNTVETVAGDGRCGSAAGQLCAPYEAHAAPGGEVFISDSLNHRVALLAGGQLSTLAGGVRGFADGVGAAARFDHPRGIHLLDDGSLLVADTFNHRLRRVQRDGTVTTVAGGPDAGTVDFDAQDGGTPGDLRLNHPEDVTADDAGTWFVTEYHRVRRISPLRSGTAAGATEQQSAGLGHPRQVALDLSASRLYVADGSHCVRRADLAPDGGPSMVSTFIGSSSCKAGFVNANAYNTELRVPTGVAVLAGGALAFSDLNHRVRLHSQDTTSDLAGGPLADRLLEGLTPPQALARLPDGRLFWLEPELSVLRELRPDGGVRTLIGSAEAPVHGHRNGPLAKALLDHPEGLAATEDGALFIADTQNNAIRRVDLEQGTIETYAGSDPADGGRGLSGEAIGPRSAARFKRPTALTVAAGELYVIDFDNDQVRRIDLRAGEVFAAAGDNFGKLNNCRDDSDFVEMVALAVEETGTLYIVNHAEANRHDVWSLVKAEPGACGLFPSFTRLITEEPRRIDALAPLRAGALLGAAHGQLFEISTVSGRITQRFPSNGDPDYRGVADGDPSRAMMMGVSSLLMRARGVVYLTDGLGQRVRRVQLMEGP